MDLVKTEEAVGLILCHDITEIVVGGMKGPAFKKGHVVQQEDIPHLLRLGKDHLYVWSEDSTLVHENDAAEILLSVAMGEGFTRSGISEGKIELKAAYDGMFTVDTELLKAINSIPEISIASRFGGFTVHKGDKCAGMRVIPLAIKKETMDKVVETAAGKKIFNVLPYKPMSFGVIITGNEVYYGRIQDTFTPVLEKKLEEFGAVMKDHVVLGDDAEAITAEIKRMADEGLDLILCTGGMSVDPDDRTPLAIRSTGAEIITYGSPVLPGAMFLVSYLPDGRPVLGLPGCVMHSKRTVFDVLLPKVMAGVRISKDYIAPLGNGGLCLGCKECHFPNCMFGKGA